MKVPHVRKMQVIAATIPGLTAFACSLTLTSTNASGTGYTATATINTDYGTTTASYNGTTVADVGGGNVWITCEGVPSMSDGEVLHNVTAFGKTKNYPTGEMTYADSHITGTSGSAKGVAKYQ